MRLLATFLRILSTSLLLSLLSLSSTRLLTSATPIAQRLELDTGDLYAELGNIKSLFAHSPPEAGSLIWAKGIDMKPSTGLLQGFRTVVESRTARCAMLVIDTKDGMFRGIVFAKSPKDVLSKAFLLAYTPLTEALKTGIGEEFKVFAGWGQVSEGKLERNGDGSFKKEKPLDDRTMERLRTTFENLLKEKTPGLRWRVGRKMEK